MSAQNVAPRVMLALVPVLLFTGCGDSPDAESQPPKRPDHSAASPTAPELRSATTFPGKGAWEVYSWQSRDGEWRFSIVPHTNRLKSRREVTDPAIALSGLAELKHALARIPKGQSVFWMDEAQLASDGREPTLAYPPEQVMNDIDTYCRRMGIRLSVPGSRLEPT